MQRGLGRLLPTHLCPILARKSAVLTAFAFHRHALNGELGVDVAALVFSARGCEGQEASRLISWLTDLCVDFYLKPCRAPASSSERGSHLLPN